jgi:hypothetical protein
MSAHHTHQPEAQRPVNVGGTARHEEAKSVRMIEPSFGADWLSARNRALHFRLVKKRRSRFRLVKTNVQFDRSACRLKGALSGLE